MNRCSMPADRTKLRPDAAVFAALEPFRHIGSLANRAVPQVSLWLTASRAAVVLQANAADEALVVDGDGAPVGVVTATALRTAAPEAYTGQVMSTIGAVLHESVPASVAISLMASLPADRIAVIGDGRRALGLLSASDLSPNRQRG